MTPASAVLPSLDSTHETHPRSVAGSCSAFEVLLSCCREPRPGLIANRFPSAWTEADWDGFVALAEHHRVLPLVHAGLEQCHDLIPVRVRQRLQSLVLEHARSALWFTSEMLRIVRHLDDRGIPVIPYKGPVLAQALYGDVCLRQFGDLDFLVQDTDVFRARAALRELGYECEQKMTARQERAHLASHYEHTFSGARKRNLIELKWRILPRFYAVDFDFAGFFERAVTINIADVPLRTLCDEDLLLVLSVHAAKHAWNQLSLVADIARLAAQPDCDWNKIVAQTKKLRVERIVLANLCLARELFGMEMPAGFRAQSAELQNIVDQRIQALAHAQDVKPNPHYFRLMLQLREDWRDRTRFLWRLSTTPSAGEWSAVSLPEYLFPLYALVRLFRLSRRLLA
jgi:hypothetical protein